MALETFCQMASSLPAGSTLKGETERRTMSSDSPEVSFRKMMRSNFLDAGSSRGELLTVLAARTKWKLFGLEAEPVAAAEALSKGCQVFEGNFRAGSWNSGNATGLRLHLSRKQHFSALTSLG